MDVSLGQELCGYRDQSLLVVLNVRQLGILDQVFRPIMVGELIEVTNDYAVFVNVNIKMTNAPEFIFPTPLIIPLDKIAWFMPFSPDTRFSIY